jgi:hypothetical protein
MLNVELVTALCAVPNCVGSLAVVVVATDWTETERCPCSYLQDKIGHDTFLLSAFCNLPASISTSRP